MTQKSGQLEIEVEDDDGCGPVLVAHGEVDACTAPRLGNVLDRTLSEHPSRVLLDLSDVSFMDSTGLPALLTANRVAGTDTIFAVVATGAPARPLRLTGLDAVIPVYPYRTMAMACTTAAVTQP
jgi:anti-sigma B factor antagonist